MVVFGVVMCRGGVVISGDWEGDVGCLVGLG